jgi:diaminohydroxyphosphoribosylaminopyrimidine deaminase/5-amino-6-(5-phosphoribosylamino)uracil reductase
LGGNVPAVEDVGVTTLSRALHWEYDQIERMGPDVLLSLVPRLAV